MTRTACVIRLMTGDLSFAREHFDALVPNALGVAGTPWPLDPSTGLINSSDVLIDWPAGMQDRYELTPQNSVANAFGYCKCRFSYWLGQHSVATRVICPYAGTV